jgi:hypothetical protein
MLDEPIIKTIKNLKASVLDLERLPSEILKQYTSELYVCLET